MARAAEIRRPLERWLNWSDIVPALVLVVLAIEVVGAHYRAPPERVSQPVRATVKRNGDTAETVCRRYDVPVELCREIEIDGDKATLLLDPDPIRPGGAQAGAVTSGAADEIAE